MAKQLATTSLGTIGSAILSGTCASIASAAALGIAALLEGKAAIRPINATSHWLEGPSAGSYEGIDAAHTGIGYLTNHAASIFWAIFFEGWRARRRPVRAVPMLEEAAVMTVIAAAVDYGATPKRFTPGWEFVLSKKGMAIGYAGLALGLAAGALWSQSYRRPSA